MSGENAFQSRAYRIALLERLDGQIRLARSIRYWYVLPAWVFFLMVLISGVKGLAFAPLLAEFLSATALCVFVVWLNEKYGVRRLEAERDRVDALTLESRNED